MLDKNVPQPWQGQTTLVLALAAVAVGIGNLFRFPYLLGAQGGASFFVAYVLTVFAVVAPILSAEVMLGSQGRGSPLGAMRWASDLSGRAIYWSWIGPLQAIIALLLAAKIALIAAWLLDRALLLNTGELSAASAQDVARSFLGLDGQRIGLLILAILAVLTPMVALGPQYALGIMGWLALPGMAVALFGLLDFTMANGNLERTGEFLFAARNRDVTLPSIMSGVVSGLFTAGAGMGIGLCFGARTPRRLPLIRSVLAALVLDIAFALATAVVIIPLLFATNTQPVGEMALMFIAVPYAFANLPQGEVYGALFFGFAALSSVVAVLALMEPVVMIVRRDVGITRWLVAPLASLLVLLLALSSYWEPASIGWMLTQIIDAGVLLGILLTAMFVGWRMPRPIVRGEMYREPRWLFGVWWELLRLVVPVSLALVALWLWVEPIRSQ